MYHVRGLRVIGQITIGDQEHGPSPQILNGMSNTGRNGESSHHTIREHGILHPLPTRRADFLRNVASSLSRLIRPIKSVLPPACRMRGRRDRLRCSSDGYRLCTFRIVSFMVSTSLMGL